MIKSSQILVADDDISQCEEMSEFLISAGFSVVTAIDGYDAIEKIVSTSPRVILLDINMPGWNGLRVSEVARNLDHRCVIILMTGDDASLAKAAKTECGAVCVFAKPVQLSKLVDFLEATVGKRHVENIIAAQ